MTTASRTTAASTQETVTLPPDTSITGDLGHQRPCPPWCRRHFTGDGEGPFITHEGAIESFGDASKYRGTDVQLEVNAEMGWQPRICVDDAELTLVDARRLAEHLVALADTAEGCPAWCSDHQNFDGLPGGFHQATATVKVSRDVTVVMADNGIDDRTPCIFYIRGHHPDDELSADDAEALAAQLNRFAADSRGIQQETEASA